MDLEEKCVNNAVYICSDIIQIDMHTNNIH